MEQQESTTSWDEADQTLDLDPKTPEVVPTPAPSAAVAEKVVTETTKVGGVSQTKQTRELAVVEVDNRGLLVGGTIEGEYRICQYLAKSGMMPKQYTTPEKIMAGRQFARELGLPGLIAMRQIAVIEGTPSMFGDLPLAVVRRSGLLERIREYLIDKDGKEISRANGNLSAVFHGAVCEVKRQGCDPVEFVFTLDDAERAGLHIPDEELEKAGKAEWANKYKYRPWYKYKKLMLKYRTRSMALKDQFGDVLNGMSIGEYDHHATLEDAIETTGKEVKVDVKEINDGLKNL